MSEDLRVTKTRQNIQMTFIRLLEQCRFQDITIKQLIQECQINRSTFYRNYEDKYDLIQKIADELLVQFQKAINPGFIALNGKKENYISYFSPILHFFEQKKAILKMMARQTLPVNIFDEMHMIYSHALFEELCKRFGELLSGGRSCRTGRLTGTVHSAVQRKRCPYQRFPAATQSGNHRGG